MMHMPTMTTYPMPAELLPHRAPILQIEAIQEFVAGAYLSATKTILADNPFLAGHFPGYPIMPGVIVVEMLYQCCGLYLRMLTLDQARKPGGQHLGGSPSQGLHHGEDQATGSISAGDRVTGLHAGGGRAVKIDGLTFRGEIRPGMTIRLIVKPRLIVMRFAQFTGRVEDEAGGCLVDGVLTVSI
jgi:3-hydroxyacyl-[acyl-carrier-protein] dehydratase